MPIIGVGGTGNIDSFQADEQGSDPSTPAAGKRGLYPKSDGWYDIDDAGNVTGPLVSAVGGGATTKLYETLLTGTVANIDITGISSSYRHLRLVFQGRKSTASEANLALTLNNDGGSNYYRQNLYGSAATAATSEGLGVTALNLIGIPGSDAAAGLASSMDLIIPNYAQTTFIKTLIWTGIRVALTSTGGMTVYANGGFWNSTAAINRITLAPASGSFVAGTIATLYGIN